MFRRLKEHFLKRVVHDNHGWWPIVAAVAKSAAGKAVGGIIAKKIGFDKDASVTENIASMSQNTDSSVKPTDTSGLSSLESSLSKMMKQDMGFYGHNKVKGMKQDSSGFYKQKKVSQRLF